MQHLAKRWLKSLRKVLSAPQSRGYIVCVHACADEDFGVAKPPSPLMRAARPDRRPSRQASFDVAAQREADAKAL